MKKMICFDMDGTVADLYAVPHWLENLNEENPAPYIEAAPMWDMKALADVLALLREADYEIRIITWLAMNSSEEYKMAVREAKKAWLDKWGFMYDHFHAVQYGTTKADSVRKLAGNAILIDDNEKVRNGWTLGETIDPTACDLVKVLRNLVAGA